MPKIAVGHLCLRILVSILSYPLPKFIKGKKYYYHNKKILANMFSNAQFKSWTRQGLVSAMTIRPVLPKQVEQLQNEPSFVKRNAPKMFKKLSFTQIRGIEYSLESSYMQGWESNRKNRLNRFSEKSKKSIFFNRFFRFFRFEKYT